MPAPQISPLPNPPSRSQSPETFSTDADVFLGALPDFQSEANDQADYLDALAIAVDADAVAADADAASALSSKNAALASQTAAAVSAAAALVSENAAAASFDSFDDRYLGAKSSNPSVDNDGGALLTGALYFNTTSNQMRVYNGSVWEAAYLPAGNYVQGAASSVDGALVAFDGITGKVIKQAANVTVSQGGTGATTLAANNVLIGNGTSAVSAVAPSTAGNVLTSNGTAWVSQAAPPSGPTLQAIASGSLADGSRVIVNADGTVSVVALTSQLTGSKTVFEYAACSAIRATYDSANQRVVIAYRDEGNLSYGTAVVGTVSGTSISFGTPVVFSAATTQHLSVVYHSVQQKIVIAYRNEANSDYGTAKVGTVSGTSISFGTAVVFRSADVIYISAVYDSANQKVVIAYRDRGNVDRGTAIVGTVSGTSISFGGSVVFDNLATSEIAAVYDSANQKVVIAYQDGGTSNGEAIVGTVSGTSISFGTSVVFSATGGDFFSPVFDSLNQKVVIAYRSGALSYGYAIVGTVSGTSISFGGPFVFNAAASLEISATYDANARKVLIAYQDQGNSLRGTAITGIVSGTNISFESPVVFENGQTNRTRAIYDSVQQKVVIPYNDVPNGVFGTAVVFRVAFSTLTAENFIGFSNGVYTNGQTATIQIIGSVDDAQSGLTAGQSYFVQNDGLLGLTASIPSVFAGTAVAANKIIVKG